MAGGILFGVLSDYFGRVRMLTWTILIFAVFTGLCALAQGYADLLAYRTIAGLGLGGEFGIGMTLVAEAWPASQRARVSSYVGLGWQLGVLAAALLTPLLLPVIGWRGMFALGLAPAVVSFIVRRRVEEPALFVERAEHARTPRANARKLPLLAVVADARTTRASIGVAILCSVQNFGYYGLMIWLPSYLSKTFGYSLTKSGLWTSATILGMALGIWLFGIAADRFGRKPTFLFYQVGAVVMVFVYAHLSTPFALLIGGAVMGVFVNGMIGGYGALISELYPTRGACDRAERAVQHRAGGWRFWAGRGWRAGCALFVRRGARVARVDLSARHSRDPVPDPRTTRRRPRLTPLSSSRSPRRPLSECRTAAFRRRAT